MSIVTCCRTCLSKNSLNPLFLEPAQEEIYASIFNLVTGVAISSNDDLPKQICDECVNFINRSLEFRNHCLESHRALLGQCRSGIDLKTERHSCDTELKTDGSYVFIDIHKAKDLVGETVIKVEEVKNGRDDDYVSDVDSCNILTVTNAVAVKKERKKGALVKRQKVRQKNDVRPKTDVRHKLKKCDEDRTKVKLKHDEPVATSNANNDGPTEEKPEDYVKCDICCKIVKVNGYKSHYKTHTGFDLVCEHCGKLFVSRRKLLTHCKAKHGYEKTDKCSYCDYRGSNVELVKIHERLHTGEKPYTCKVCGVGFHRNSNYIQHLPIHLAEKTVQCDQCPAMFKSVTLMRIHKYTRHKVCKYQYKCCVCKKTFARRYNVLKHLRSIHGVTGRDEARQVERVKVAG